MKMAKAEQAPIHKYIKKINTEADIGKQKSGRVKFGEESPEQMARFHAKDEKPELFRGSAEMHEKSDMGAAVDAVNQHAANHDVEEEE
jgi:hypothetical protein